jgi:hypothetical protein
LEAAVDAWLEDEDALLEAHMTDAPATVIRGGVPSIPNYSAPQHRRTDAPTHVSTKITTGPSGGFGLATTEDTTPATAFDLDIATKLFTACQRFLGASHDRLRKSKPTAWAEHIRLLRTTDGYTEAEIRRGLTWFTENIKDKFTPHAYNGEAFRKKFPAILEKANKGLIGIEISEAAAKLIQFLHVRNWPATAQAQLPAAVQVSFTAYREWLAARNATTARLIEEYATVPHNIKTAPLRELVNFGEHLKNCMPSSNNMMLEWFHHILRRYAAWPDWSGDLQPLLFHSGAAEFQRMGREWAQRWCAHPGRWDAFCARMEIE